MRALPCLHGHGYECLVGESQAFPLLDQFVRVRLINANSLDLQKFQFDYDLSFSVLFFNGDGTLYGRFGSWEHQRNPQDKTTSSFESSLRGALDVHRGYPNNRTLLSAKQGKPVKYRTPLDMPGLKGKFRDELNWVEKWSRAVSIAIKSETPSPRAKGPGADFPSESCLSIPFVRDHRDGFGTCLSLRIKKLAGDSPVRKAGLREGDFLLGAEGQSLISAADLSWVLHHFSDAGGKLELFARRDSRTAVVQVDLGPSWRLKSDISEEWEPGRCGRWPLVESSSSIFLIPNGLLRGDKLALKAEHVGQYNKHAAAKRAGWKKGDALVGVAGHGSRLSESELIGLILQKHSPGRNCRHKFSGGARK